MMGFWKVAYEHLPEPLRQVIDRASHDHQLPDGLLPRLLWQESRFNPKAYNRGSEASGIAQIVPRWHPAVDPWIPAEAIPYAAAYLDNLHGQFGSWKLALAAYNWGPGNLAKHGLSSAPPETENYYKQILADIATEYGSRLA